MVFGKTPVFLPCMFCLTFYAISLKTEPVRLCWECSCGTMLLPCLRGKRAVRFSQLVGLWPFYCVMCHNDECRTTRRDDSLFFCISFSLRLYRAGRRSTSPPMHVSMAFPIPFVQRVWGTSSTVTQPTPRARKKKKKRKGTTGYSKSRSVCYIEDYPS